MRLSIYNRFCRIRDNIREAYEHKKHIKSIDTMRENYNRCERCRKFIDDNLF